jgi:arylsulfatase A-like enzyme
MRGGKAALWNDETMAQVFAEKAVRFITENKDQPFFLYYALHQPHVPRLPGEKFKGATRLGARGDVIVEMDWCVGQVLEALDRLGLRENTIVIFSSDNGPVLDDGYVDQAQELVGNHKAAGPLRGGKYSLFDGGARVPLIVRWPGRVQPGESAAMVSHLDFYASFAALTGQALDSDEAPDSLDLSEVFFGTSPLGRQELVTEGTWRKTVLRQGSWAYIPPHDGPAVNANTRTELGNAPQPQLYDLSQDLGQVTNVAGKFEDKVGRMQAILDQIHKSDRTRPRPGEFTPSG